MQSIFSDHSSMKLQVNYRKKNVKGTNNVVTEQHATENKEKESMKNSKRKSENTSIYMIMETQLSKIDGMQQKNIKGKFIAI